MITRISTPSVLSSPGKDLATSPKPPILKKGSFSQTAKSTFMFWPATDKMEWGFTISVVLLREIRYSTIHFVAFNENKRGIWAFVFFKTNCLFLFFFINPGNWLYIV